MVPKQTKEELIKCYPSKSPLLWVLSVASLVAVLVAVVLPWLLGSRGTGRLFVFLAVSSAAAWSVILLWAFHQVGMQVAALFPGDIQTCTGDGLAGLDNLPRFLVLYTTCDDFLPQCCLSCVDQHYPKSLFDVVVCDDSRGTDCEGGARAFSDLHRARYVRRINHDGHKAGNLNNAFEEMALQRYDWVVVVDADQSLPKDYLMRMAKASANVGDEVAFIQAGRDRLPDDAAPGSGPELTNPFQQALAPEIVIFFERDMCARYRFGLFPFLGHGGAIRASSWRTLGGFPHRVSEDYAFSLRVRAQGMWGAKVDSIRCGELYPVTFCAFVVRMSKFAAGAAQLIRRELPAFYRSGATLTEKVDATMFLGSYALAPLFLLNLFLSVYICRWAWLGYVPLLAPELAYIFMAVSLFTVSVLVSVTPSMWSGVRYWLWAFAVYSAALPTTAAAFIAFLFRDPPFRRTPKLPHSSPALARESAIVSLLGVAGLAGSLLCISPFSFVLAATSFAMMCFPIYRWLDQAESFRGRVARTLVHVPCLLFVIGLASMWWWATM